MIADLWLVQFLTSDFVLGLVKPVVIAGVIGMMLWIQVKPRVKNSDKVQL